MADSIWNHNCRPRALTDMGLVLSINSNISFHFRLFPRKTNDKIFQKILNPYFGVTWAFFAQIWTKMNFPEKKGSVKFLNILIIYHRAKNKKKLIVFLRKMLNWRIDGQTDRRTGRKPWFCRTLCRTGVQLLKSKFKLSWIYKPVYSINFFVWYSQF